MTDRADPIREWQAARRERADDADAQRMLAAAVDQDDDEHQDDEQDTAPARPRASLDALTPGGNPADYQPPTVAEQFAAWARASVYR